MNSLKPQARQVVLMLRTGPKTTNQFRRASIADPATRVFELKGMGFVIDTTMIEVKNQFGQKTRAARYTLVKEPAWAKRNIKPTPLAA